MCFCFWIFSTKLLSIGAFHYVRFCFLMPSLPQKWFPLWHHWRFSKMHLRCSCAARRGGSWRSLEGAPFPTSVKGLSKDDTGIFVFPDSHWHALTFEVQVAGTVGVLSNGAWVNLEHMYIVGISGHHHVVPLVVIEWLVWVALHQWRPIAKIKDIVDIPVKKVEDSLWVFSVIAITNALVVFERNK